MNDLINIKVIQKDFNGENNFEFQSIAKFGDGKTPLNKPKSYVR
ncbi:MAG: hypothetical protein V1688_04065 [bacterium]